MDWEEIIKTVDTMTNEELRLTRNKLAMLGIGVVFFWATRSNSRIEIKVLKENRTLRRYDSNSNETLREAIKYALDVLWSGTKV